MRSKTKTNRDLLARVFPRLAPVTRGTPVVIDHIRILGIELDRACNGGSCGGIY